MPDPDSIGQHTSLFLLAVEAGFRDHLATWNDAPNASLKQARVNPHTLVPGDLVTIPELEAERAEGKATERFHRFTVRATGLLLKLAIQDLDRNPEGGRTVQLFLGAKSGTGGGVDVTVPTTHLLDGDGALEQVIDPATTEGEARLLVGEDPAQVQRKIRLLVGGLEPPNTIRGQQARLNNLGYFAGFTDDHTVQLTWAIEEFQLEHGLKPTGKTDDPATFNKLAHVHGDLLESERVP